MYIYKYTYIYIYQAYLRAVEAGRFEGNLLVSAGQQPAADQELSAQIAAQVLKLLVYEALSTSL
jgi:uncharacterized protein YcsI (UPF0317 family)